MLKKLFIATLFLTGFLTGYSQVTATFQPDAADGKDAFVYIFYDCSGPDLNQNNNTGTSNRLSVSQWTYNSGQDCNDGTHRTFIEFSKIDCIPSNATIVSADLNLYGHAVDVYNLSDGNTQKTNPINIGRVETAWNKV